MAPQETATKGRQGNNGMVERDFSPYGPVAVPLILSGQIIARFHQASAKGRRCGLPTGNWGRQLTTLVANGPHLRCRSGTFDRKFAVSKHIIPQGQSLKQDRTSHGRLGKDGRPINCLRRVANAKDQGAEATRRRPCNDWDSRSHRSSCLTTTPTPHSHAHSCRQ